MIAVLSPTAGPIGNFVWLLLLAALTAVVAQRVRVPYTVALVVVGLLASALGFLHDFRATASLILLVFLPPLLFQAALDLELPVVGRMLSSILALAVPGVIGSTVIVGAIVARVTPLPLWPAILFGALISATDPVAVVAIFRQLGAPRELSTLIEGEALLNDGTALALSVVLITAAETNTFDAFFSIALLVWSVAGGILAGAALAFAVSRATGMLDDLHVEITLSTILAYGSYLVGNSLHASGAIAVVVAGLVYGRFGREEGMVAASRERLDDFWSYVNFLANAVLFILIGLRISLPALSHVVAPIAGALIAVQLARAVIVYALAGAVQRISLRYAHVLVWGGLRGGVALAVALSLPESIPGHALILQLTFAVVLFTIVVQGLTIQPLASRLGLLSRPDDHTLSR